MGYGLNPRIIFACLKKLRSPNIERELFLIGVHYRFYQCARRPWAFFIICSELNRFIDSAVNALLNCLDIGFFENVIFDQIL